MGLSPTSSLRALRLSIRPELSLRELGRRSGISSGRLSIIERGVEPTPAERAAILRILTGLLDAMPDGRPTL